MADRYHNASPSQFAPGLADLPEFQATTDRRLGGEKTVYRSYIHYLTGHKIVIRQNLIYGIAHTRNFVNKMLDVRRLPVKTTGRTHNKDDLTVSYWKGLATLEGFVGLIRAGAT